MLKYDYKVYSIKAYHPGISDRGVLEIVKEFKGILITEDKDFGELIFSYGMADVSVLLMRYDQPQYHLIEEYVLKCLHNYFSDLMNVL
jgi:predicted nuclease of predicted toxin-antitoxin system